MGHPGPARQATSVKFIWNSNYNGIHFPAEKTVVLRIDGPESPHYWRTTTLDVFTRDHWFEDLYWLGQVDSSSRALGLPSLVPRRAADPRSWVEQRVRVEALVDDHLAAAGTPMGVEARRLGTVFHLSGGVLRASALVGAGESYRVWSYVPEPAPRTLASAPVRYPPAIEPFLVLEGASPPVLRNARPRSAPCARSSTIRRMRTSSATGRSTSSPTASPAEPGRHTRRCSRSSLGSGKQEASRTTRRRLTFEDRPARRLRHADESRVLPALRRSNGRDAPAARDPVSCRGGLHERDNADGTWVVTDHDAHAWVEVWFPGVGWIPFDPTPGRGRFGGDYSFASTSATAVAALRRGELSKSSRPIPNRRPDVSDLGTTGTVGSRAPSLVGVLLVLAALWVAAVGMGKTVVRRARYLSRDPRRVATASRRELEGFLRDQGAAVPRNATLVTLQDAVYRELGLDGRAYAIAAARARFGPPHTAEQGAASARSELRRLLRAARSELSLWARFRGFVSLRSLRSAGTP